MDLASKFLSLRQLPPEQLLARASEILPPWVTAVLVIAVAWQLARVTWLLVPHDVTPAAPITVEQASAPAAGRDTGVDVAKIIDARLFGDDTAHAPDIPPPPTIELQEETELTLRGVISDAKPEFGLAIISEQGGEEKVYKVGDNLPRGRRLHSVYPEKVIVLRGTEMRQLTLPKELSSSSFRNARAAASPRAPRRAQSSLREYISRNPARLTDIIRPQPVFVDGKQRGYRVYPGRERQQFSALGLKPGDLVTEINGTSLDDPARGMEIFRSLGEASQVTVTVQRNGQPQVLTLDTQVLQQTIQQGRDD